MRSSERNVFLKIILSYFSVLLIPLTVGVIIYLSAVSSVTKMTRDYSYSMLTQMVNVTDIRLRELEYMPFYYKTNSDTLRLLSLSEIPEGGAEYFEIYKAYTNTPQFRLINSMISDVQILMVNNTHVISQNSALRLNDATYNALFGYTGMEYSEFLAFVDKRSYSNSFVQFTSPKHGVTSAFVSSLTYSNAGQPLATIIVQLKNSALSDMLGELLVGDGGMAFILDESNNLVASSIGATCTLSIDSAVEYAANAQATDTEYSDFIASNLLSSYNGWKYCVFSPRDEVLAQVSQTQITTLALIATAVGLSVIFTYMLCRHKAASLKKVLLYLNDSSIEPSFAVPNEYTYIATAASGLVSKSKQLNRLMEQQKPILDAAVLRNLLAGDLYRTEEIQHLFAALNIRPDNQRFAVAFVTIEPHSEESLTKYSEFPVLISAVTRQLIDQYKRCPTFCLDIDSYSKALVFISDDTDEGVVSQKVHEFAQIIYRAAIDKHRLTMGFYISDIYSLVDDIPRAFLQAKLISSQVTKAQDAFIFTTADIPQIQKLYYYPVKTELELIQLIKSGDSASVEQLFQTVYEENFVKRSLSGSMTQQLLFAMRGSILRGVSDLPMSETMVRLLKIFDNANSVQSLADCAVNLNKELNHAARNAASAQVEQQKKNILQYIEEHYTQNDFTIYHICEAFQISENAMYQFFREAVGTSFADIVESMRIESACKLLQERRESIKEVSMLVGYTNDNSFRRAFKRVMGVTPSEYMSC